MLQASCFKRSSRDSLGSHFGHCLDSKYRLSSASAAASPPPPRRGGTGFRRLHPRCRARRTPRRNLSRSAFFHSNQQYIFIKDLNIGHELASHVSYISVTCVPPSRRLAAPALTYMSVTYQLHACRAGRRKLMHHFLLSKFQQQKKAGFIPATPVWSPCPGVFGLSTPPRPLTLPLFHCHGLLFLPLSSSLPLSRSRLLLLNILAPLSNRLVEFIQKVSTNLPPHRNAAPPPP